MDARPRRHGQNQGLVRSGRMNRTWNDWGFRNGIDDARARSLLKALQARAAGTALDKLEWEQGETIAQLSAQIDGLVACSGLCEVRLADELAHDIKLWARHWEITRDLYPRTTRESCTDKPAPIRRVSGGGLLRSQQANNSRVGNTTTTAQEYPENAESPGSSGNAGTKTAASAPPSLSAASVTASRDMSGSSPQTADVAAPDQPAHANVPGGEREKAIAKRGPKPGTVARFRDDDAALFPAIEALIIGKRMSQRAATLLLSEQGKVTGTGTDESRATRLRKAYSAFKNGARNSIQLNPN